MIRVNGRDFEWREGLTIRAILKAHKYTSPRVIVKVDGELVRQENWDKFIVQDGADVRAIHLIGGG